MIKIFIFRNLPYTAILLCCLLYAFTSAPASSSSKESFNKKVVLNYDFPKRLNAGSFQGYKFINYVELERSLIGFKEALAFKESRGRYQVVNSLGYLGKYQFGISTLKLLGIYDTANFLLCPELQEKAFMANLKRNKWVLRRDIKRFVGQEIKGTIVTESGILAAAHLAGPGSVKRYLRSQGTIGFKDAFGTDIASYIEKFAAFDTSVIAAERHPKINIL
jgi:hypothetical protein